MPPSAATIARDRRILAGYRAGRSLLDLALAEELDPAIVRRVLRAAGIEPGPNRPTNPEPGADRLTDPAWLRAEYATKSAQQLAKELGCPRDRVYEALHAAGIPPRVNGHGAKRREGVTPETADRIVALYLAGASPRRVADELGLAVPLVNDVVEERGVKRTRSEAAALAQAARRGKPSGAPIARPPGEWPAELTAEVLDRYAAGASGVRIAEELGLAQTSVYRLLGERGVLRSRREAARLQKRGERRAREASAPTERKGLPEDVAEEAVARYVAGEPAKAVAVMLGVPADRVYAVLRERTLSDGSSVLRTKSEARVVAHARRPAAEAWPAELAAQVVQRYAAGASASAVAAELGVGRSRVCRLLRERGMLRTRSEASKLREARQRPARKLDEAQRRTAKVAARGQEAGLPAPGGANRRRSIWPAELAAAVVERYAAGESGETIARDLGLGQGRVYKLLRERGVLRTLGEACALREERRRGRDGA